MARFYTRRDNQYVSDYVPLPLGLMQQALQQRQQQKDASKQLGATISPFKEQAIQELSHRPGEFTKDYKRMQEINSYVMKEKNRLNELVDKEDKVEEATRGILNLKNFIEKQSQQGGEIYNIGESFKKWEEGTKTIQSSDQSLKTKEALQKEFDLKYDIENQYSGGVYKVGNIGKFKDVQEAVSDNAKRIESDINESHGTFNKDLYPGYIYHKDWSNEEKTYNQIVQSTGGLLTTDGLVKENFDRLIQNKANEIGLKEYNRVLDEKGTKSEAIEAYNKAVKKEKDFQYSGAYVSNWSKDKNNNLQPPTEEYEVDGKKYRRGTLAAEFMQRAGIDFNKHIISDKQNINVDDGFDFGTGKAKAPSIQTTIDKVTIHSKSMTFDEIEKESKVLQGTMNDLKNQMIEAEKNNDHTTYNNLTKRYNTALSTFNNYQNVISADKKAKEGDYKQAAALIFDSNNQVGRYSKTDKRSNVEKQAELEGLMKQGYSPVYLQGKNLGSNLFLGPLAVPIMAFEGLKTLEAQGIYNKNKDKKYTVTTQLNQIAAVDESSQLGKLIKAKDKQVKNTSYSVDAFGNPLPENYTELIKDSKGTLIPPQAGLTTYSISYAYFDKDDNTTKAIIIPVNSFENQEKTILKDALATDYNNPIVQSDGGYANSVISTYNYLDVYEDVGEDINSAFIGESPKFEVTVNKNGNLEIPTRTIEFKRLEGGGRTYVPYLRTANGLEKLDDGQNQIEVSTPTELTNFLSQFYK